MGDLLLPTMPVGYGGLDAMDATEWGPGGEMGGQKRSFFMWVQNKLLIGGFPTIGYESMFDDFSDGIVVSHLIRTLASPANLKKFPVHGIADINKRPLHPLAAGANFNLMFPYLTKVEDMKGMSALPVPALMNSSSTHIMGLIFKLMQHYTIGNPADADDQKLLDWVKPRCAAHKEVKNFSSSWKDGKAIVALWNYLITEDAELYKWLVSSSGGELTIDIDKCITDTEGAILSAVSRFHKIMDVPLMITPNDMVHQKIEFRPTNEVYIAEIRRAMVQWYPEERKKFEMTMEEEDTDLTNIQIGLDFYENALRALRIAQTSSTTTTDEILTVASDDMSECIHPVDEQFDTICTSARNKLGPNDGQYDKAQDLFKQAEDAFKLVKGRKASDLNKKWGFKTKMTDCKEKIVDCDNYKDQTHDNLDVKLDELRNHWKAKKTLEYTLEQYKNELDSIQTTFDEVVDKTIRSFEGTKTERHRRENTAKGRAEVLSEIEKILPFKEMFETTEYVVSSDEDKQICKDKYDEIDNWYNFWLNDYDNKLSKELDRDVYADEEEVAALLAVYHKFSVDLDTIVAKQTDEQGQLIPASDPGIGSDYNQMKSRLDMIHDAVQQFHHSERDLRKQVQKAVDDKFDGLSLPGKTWYKPNYSV